MSFPRYPKYKDSGVEWLGAIPSHWQTLPIKRVVAVPITDGPHETPEFVDEGVPFVSAEAVSSGRIDFSKVRGYISEADNARYSVKYSPQRHDIYMVKSGATTGITAIVEGRTDFNIWSPLAVIRCGARVLPHFMLNFMRCRHFLEAVSLSWSFGTQQNIGMGVIEKLPCTVPSLEEQTTIAAFLDRETAKIDALVTEQERLIELLKEKRQAVISHAVTKGLNSDAPMKDSGVEWLGEIPAHWEVSPLKYSITRIDQGWSPQCESYPAQDGEWGVLKVGCGNGDTFDPSEQKALPSDVPPEPRYEIQAGDILMSRGNTQDLVGAATLIEKPYDRLLISDLLYRFRSNPERALAQYLVLSLRSCHGRFQIERTATGTSASMKKIGQGDIRNFVLPLPPLSEQATICTFSRQCSSRLNSLIAEAQRAIELLQERRTALISAAVTGQIDVRGAEARAV